MFPDFFSSNHQIIPREKKKEKGNRKSNIGMRVFNPPCVPREIQGLFPPFNSLLLPVKASSNRPGKRSSANSLGHLLPVQSYQMQNLIPAAFRGDLGGSSVAGAVCRASPPSRPAGQGKREPVPGDPHELRAAPGTVWRSWPPTPPG